MLLKARMLPPIRADTAAGNGEPQLQKKRLKTEYQLSKRKSEIVFLYGGIMNES